MKRSKTSTRADSKEVVELAELQRRGEELLQRAHALAHEAEKHLWELTHEHGADGSASVGAAGSPA